MPAERARGADVPAEHVGRLAHVDGLMDVAVGPHRWRVGEPLGLLQSGSDVDDQLVLVAQPAGHGQAVLDQHVVRPPDECSVEVHVGEAVKAVEDEIGSVAFGDVDRGEAPEVEHVGPLVARQVGDVHPHERIGDELVGEEIELEVARDRARPHAESGSLDVCDGAHVGDRRAVSERERPCAGEIESALLGSVVHEPRPLSERCRAGRGGRSLASRWCRSLRRGRRRQHRLRRRPVLAARGGAARRAPGSGPPRRAR